jgi:SAM-dependent methyltransferase
MRILKRPRLSPHAVHEAEPGTQATCLPSVHPTSSLGSSLSKTISRHLTTAIEPLPSGDGLPTNGEAADRKGTEARYAQQIATYENVYAQGAQTPWTVETLPLLSQHFLQLVATSGGGIVLDLCAGNAAATIELARSPYAQALKFVVVELNPTPVDQARLAIERAGMADRISVVQADVFRFAEHPIFELLRGRVDVFERYGLTTHSKPRMDRRLYWSVVRTLLRKDGHFFVTTFSKNDQDFYGYNPSSDPRGEILFPQSHFKYPGIYQKFYELESLKRALRRAGFHISHVSHHPHPRVPETRFVCEVIAKRSAKNSYLEL